MLSHSPCNDPGSAPGYAINDIRVGACEIMGKKKLDLGPKGRLFDQEKYVCDSRLYGRKKCQLSTKNARFKMIF